MNDKLVIKKLNNEQLSQRLKKALIDLIKENEQDGNLLKLPNETVLAEELGVSRNSLRDVLKVLEGEGYITRQRSKGTVANIEVVNATSRIDLKMELHDMIEEEGYKPSFKTQRIEFMETLDPVFGKSEKRFLQIEKVFYADDIPAVYCIDRVADSYAKRGENEISLLKEISLYNFLENYCNTSIEYVLAGIEVSVPPKNIAECLEIPLDIPILRLDDIGYDYNHGHVIHSNLYFKSGVLNLNILRKRL